MATLRLSNLDRAAYRTKCYRKLSEYIYKISISSGKNHNTDSPKVSKLRISIELAEVRLITSIDDPYRWQTLPEVQHLFKKQISKHLIGAYRELYRGVDISFEAIPALRSTNTEEVLRGEIQEA